MINYKDYNLVYDDDNNYIIGYKSEIIRFLKDRVKIYIDHFFSKDIIIDELERLYIVKESKYEENELIRLENNDEEKSHIPDKPIAKVKVLVPYGNGFSGSDVCKYLI